MKTTFLEVIDFTNREQTAKIFGTWTCKDYDLNELSEWADKHIARYSAFIANLRTLKEEIEEAKVSEMLQSVSTEDLLKEILSRNPALTFDK